MSVKSLFTVNSLLGVNDNDNYFIIDPVTRVITPPTTFKNFGVESDEKANRIYFKAPRYVSNDLDLSALNLRVNYQNAKGDKDQYIVTDVTVDGDSVIFSWVLSRKCTVYSGILSFIVCAVKTNDSGVIVNEWNTTLCSGTVLGGLEVENPEIPEDVTDLVNQLIDLVNTSISEVETKVTEGVDAVKAAEAQALEAVSNTPNSLFANAIKGTVSGEVIRVDDVSPVDHTVSVKVKSKNLIDLDKVVFNRCVRDGEKVTSDINDSYYCKLTVNYLGDYLLANKGKAITFSVDDVHNRKLSIVIFGTFKGSEDTFRSSLNVVGDTFTTFVIPNDLESVARMELRFNYDGAGSFTDTETVFEKFQLEAGNTATEYTPYVDPSTVTLSLCGEDERNIVTYTPDSEGNINAVSVSPTMSLYTDTAGVSIECEYTKDTNSVIQKLIERITALEGGV